MGCVLLSILYTQKRGHPYHTKCVLQLVQYFKALQISLEKNENVPNLPKGGGDLPFGGFGTFCFFILIKYKLC